MIQDNRAPVRNPEVDLRQGDAAGKVASVTGAWDIRALESRARPLRQVLRRSAGEAGAWDLSGVQRLDHIGALLLWQAWGKRRPAQLNLRPEHEIFFANLDQPRDEAVHVEPRDRLALIRRLGMTMLFVLGHATDIVRLFGQMLIDSMVLLRRPMRGPWREISASIYRTGSEALGITAAVGCLIGVTLSYLSSAQLRTFGADAFIVNILGIGIVRELGPMICAVLVAGRSGSAITAQLGVMRVTEELDALAVMGIPYTVRLILPKVIALAIVVPLLILWTSSVALIGGAFSAKLQLGMNMSQFLLALPGAVPTINVWLGVGKGVVFGILIALVACHFGLRIQPNTESLGVGTTRSVVTSITVVILADAVFAVLYSDVGISLT
jgi:phospholipid/cholesterol/gamma-HCH transport system permease protein